MISPLLRDLIAANAYARRPKSRTPCGQQECHSRVAPIFGIAAVEPTPDGCYLPRLAVTIA